MTIVNWRRQNSGFSLLEVMIAMAILAISLVAILNFHSTAVITSGRAQMVSVATMLAQHQMAQHLIKLEDEMTKGKLPDESSDAGDFSEIGFPNYRWEIEIRKVEIPAPPLPDVEGGDLISKIISSITEQISKATRELKLTVIWKELEEDQSIDVTTHLVSLKGTKFGVTGG